MGDVCSRLCGDSGQSKHTGLSVECEGNTCAYTPANKQPVQYSWDRRPKVDPTQFTVENKENEVVHRLPGTTGGNQFIIQNCKNSHIYVLDNTSTVTVDDCSNCVIYVGPVKTSIFLRDCTDCKVMTACQQFRLRDCKQLTVFLCCNTQPIIESSTGIQFSCFTLYYPQLKGQFDDSGLSIYNNSWSNIHDFTPVANERNFSILDSDERKVDEVMKFSQLCTVIEGLTTSASVVPRTIGSHQKPAALSSCLVLFSTSNADLITGFIAKISELKQSCMLVQTRQLKLTAADMQRVFQTDRYNVAVESGGDHIIFEVCGSADICQICRDAITAVTSTQSQQLLPHVSESCEKAAKEIDAFNDLANLQLSI